MCGKLLAPQDHVKCMQVSKTWHENIAPAAWEHVVVDYQHHALYTHWNKSVFEKVVPWQSLQTYSHHVRSATMFQGYAGPAHGY